MIGMGSIGMMAIGYFPAFTVEEPTDPGGGGGPIVANTITGHVVRFDSNGEYQNVPLCIVGFYYVIPSGDGASHTVQITLDGQIAHTFALSPDTGKAGTIGFDVSCGVAANSVGVTGLDAGGIVTVVLR